MPRSSAGELLAAVDVEGRASHCGVRHEVDGQCGDVGRADDVADRQRGTELLAVLVDLIAGQRGRQRRADKACRDQVDPDGRDLEREGLGHGGKRGRERRDERGARCRAPAAGAADEQQGASRAYLGRGVPGGLQRQQEMSVDVAACRVEVELGRRRVVATEAGDQQVVDGRGQRVEEPPEPVEVGGVEGGDAGPELEAGAVQAVGVAGGEDDAGSPGAGEPGCLEPDAGAAPDDQDGLPEQVPLAHYGRRVDRGGHGSSRRRRLRGQLRPGRLCCHVGGVPAGPVRVALVVSGITLALRRVRRPRETPWRDPLVCGVPRSRPQIYAVLIPATGSRRIVCRGPPTSQDPRPPPKLLGRRSECEELDRLLADAVAGRSRVTVLRGEAGAGKTALLGYLSGQLAGWQVARAAGVESEMELAYAGLHQLCGPMLEYLGRLPVPQRDALATVFGRSAGTAPDRFLVGLATLTLVAEVAEQQPLACIVDDAQWLDHASVQVLGFVARRLLAERIAVVCAARTGAGDHVLAGLPELPVRGLGDSDARALLLANVPGPLDAAVCAQIITESHGNPLALLELPRTWNVADLAGGFGLPSRQPVTDRIEQSYVRRLRLLPSDTQLLVLTAAAEPLGDLVLLHRAAGTLGIDLAAAGPAQDGGLLELGGRVEFAHPLVRSAAYRSAAAGDRQRVHRALADATVAETDPDRRAWHRARAAPGPDEEVAAELERSAGRAQARGGVAAAAAFLQRAVELTVDPARRAGRALAAAHASFQAGAFHAALQLAAAAEAGPLDEFQSARVDLVHGQIAFASGHSSAAASRLLLNAARR